MVKVVLNQPVRYPFGFDNVYKMGAELDVSAEDEQRLREMGVVEVEKPEPVVPSAPVEPPGVGEVPEVEKPAGRKYPPLPKKTQGANVWREYARENEIDVRGLSERAELVGHITQVVNSQ